MMSWLWLSGDVHCHNESLVVLVILTTDEKSLSRFSSCRRCRPQWKKKDTRHGETNKGYQSQSIRFIVKKKSISANLKIKVSL